MRSTRRVLGTLLTFLLVASSAFADSVDRHIYPNCRVTPRLSTNNYPGYSNVVSSNKLALPAGKSISALGQPVYLYGRVFDRNCTPITEAKIDVWHANPQGRFRFATKAALATPDPIFAGSGRATTDNLGQFQFFTVYPGPYSYLVKTGEGGSVRIRRAPHFNLRISHPEYKNFNTSLYFQGDHRNATDNLYKRLSAMNKQAVTMRVTPRADDFNLGVQVFIDIVLPYQSDFRKY